MSIKLGIIGGGNIGRAHAQAAKRNGVTTTIISDVNLDAAKTFAANEGIPKFTASAEEVFASDVDAVVIGVPNKFHASLAIAALKAGKDVLLEKPMAMTVAECKAINAAAKKKSLIVQMGFVNRYNPESLAAKSLLDAGRVGKIYHAKANVYRRRGIPGLGGWFTTKALSGGGPLIDIGVHVIDLAMHMMDFPTPVRVSGKVYANFGSRMKDYVFESMWAGPPRLDGKFDVEDSAHALVRFEGGSTLEINSTWAGNFPDGSVTDLMGFFGDKGGLSFKLYDKASLRLATEENGQNVDIAPKFRDANPWDGQYQAFIHAVTTRKPPGATGEKGQVVQSIIEAIYKSSDQNQEVKV